MPKRKARLPPRIIPAEHASRAPKWCPLPISDAATSGGRTNHSSPNYLVRFQGRVYFSADDGLHGPALWRSNGKRSGTALVKDIRPGGDHSDLHSLAVVGGRLFFAASDGVHGTELWRSDGTRAGTVLVKDINRGVGGSEPAGLTAVGGTLFFTAQEGAHGRELWRSDGTRAGTALVKDINPSNYIGEYYGHRIGDLTPVGRTLFFTADDGTHGKELWRSDGTRAGTVLVKDVNQSNNFFGRPEHLTAVGGRLFFTVDDGTHGKELWRSDGIRAGTVLVKDINPSTVDYYNGSYPDGLTAFRGKVFFSADDGIHGGELWRSDGTRAGTVMVKDHPSADGFYGITSNSLTAVGGKLFFEAGDRTHGSELWRSDGTKAGTVLVKDINPGGHVDPYYGGYSLDNSYPSELTAVGGRLFFTADDGTHGHELWRSDGTRPGTHLVKDIAASTDYNGSFPYDLTAVRGRVFFSAEDGIHGSELWRSDGTRAGTVLVKDINTRTG